MTATERPMPTAAEIAAHRAEKLHQYAMTDEAWALYLALRDRYHAVKSDRLQRATERASHRYARRCSRYGTA